MNTMNRMELSVSNGQCLLVAAAEGGDFVMMMERDFWMLCLVAGVGWVEVLLPLLRWVSGGGDGSDSSGKKNCLSAYLWWS